MEKIIAKFKSKCQETGRTLNKGEWIIYDRPNKKAYHVEAPITKAKYETEAENRSVSAYIDEQENLMYERYRH